MNYQQTLDYIYTRLPMFSRVGGQAIKNGLSNILALCARLNNPQLEGRFVHIAGTNGKGSVSHLLASVLQTAGYKTGLYTSPHLRDFRERIKINGEMIGEQAVVTFIEKIKPAIESIQPSFFEISVAMAFDHFAQNNTDIAVIETGLGGRLDSTNVINPALSVITNIGFDHVQILGDTLAKIAGEKAGIIKPGVPVVIGEKHEETAPVFCAKAAETGSPLFFAADRYHIENWQYEKEELVIEISEQGQTDHRRYRLDLSGQYQAKNLLTVLESCRQLKNRGFDLDPEAITKGLQQAKKQTGLHGRWETIAHHPRVVLDVAHNESGMGELLKQVELASYHELHLVLGMVKDKDVDGVLKMLPPNAHYYFTHAQIPRALPAAELREKAATHGLYGRDFESVKTALAEAKAHAHPDDLVLICGSVFLVGEV